jgi:hypothetical protein
MPVPASAIRKLIAKAAKNYIGAGMEIKKTPSPSRVMRASMARGAFKYDEGVERGLGQLARLRKLLEGKRGKLSRPVRAEERDYQRLLGVLGQTEGATDEFWRRLMEG